MSEWKKASEVLPASNETVVFLDKGGELDVGRYGSRCFTGINGTRHANGVDYWMSLPAITPKPPTKTEALREAIEVIDDVGRIVGHGSKPHQECYPWCKLTAVLPRLRAALESED